MKIKVLFLSICLWPFMLWADDYLRLLTLERLKLHQEAILFAKSLKQPNLDTQLVLARLYIEDNQFTKAQTILNSLIISYPQDSDIYLLKINSLLKQGKIREALIWTDIGLLFFPFDYQFYPKKWQLEAQDHQVKIPLLNKKQESDNFLVWAKAHLKKYPKDADTALKLGQYYLKNKQYHAVNELLLPYIKMYPAYIDLYLVSINASIQLKDYQKALQVCQQGLEFSPNNKDLLKKQADLNYLLTEPKKISSISSGKTFLNEAGVFNQLYYITDRKQLWDYTTLFYGRQTQFGKAFGKLNYANRLNKQALQYEFEFFPKLGEFIYLDLDASVANQPILFPHYSYGGEAFVVLPELFQFSLGDQLNRITSNIHYSRLTASWSKEVLKDINATIRTYAYFPGSGGKSLFYTLNLRQMLNESNNYFGIIVGTGTTPDLANLETVDFLVLKNRIMVSPYVNFAVLNEQLILNLSFLYQNQVFPSERIREWVGGTMGVTWRF
jgi:YaiO family outer membrane protein